MYTSNRRPLLLSATPRGLVRVAYAREDHDRVLQELADRLGARVLTAPEVLAPAAAQLREYFAGERTAFDLPLDRSLSHGFRRLVQERLPGIGYGRTTSYGELARALGRPGVSHDWRPKWADLMQAVTVRRPRKAPHGSPFDRIATPRPSVEAGPKRRRHGVGVGVAGGRDVRRIGSRQEF